MKKVITARDIDELHRTGQDLKSLPADALITPSARDRIREISEGAAVAPAPKSAGKVAAGKPQNELEAFFHSPEIRRLKEEICDIGKRLWAREYVDGNGGNISIRVGENRVLCTPTLVSKGYMKPEDICLVDLEGNQLAGTKPRTSEIRMHLAIMKAQPKAKACVHCHPPYATAFAVSGVTPPTCMVPEVEVFCGEIGLAPYDTPGTWEMGNKVAALSDKHNTILMANHGVVAWGKNVEDAYWKMEIVEAYCRTMMVTTQLGKAPNTIAPGKLKDLLKIKEQLDIPDRRIGLKECELCDNSEWRPGVTCAIGPQDTRVIEPDPVAEEIVKKVTDVIMERLK
jgi:L-fuculose-phosphate aldolase